MKKINNLQQLMVGLTSFYRHFLIALALILISGCKALDPPSNSIEVARNSIYGGALSNNGQYAVIGSLLDGGSLWRTSDGERLYNWNHTPTIDDQIIISADIAHNQQYALTTDATTLVLWDMNTGESLRFWRSPAEILDSTLSFDGRFALLGLSDHSAVIFDAVVGGVVRTLVHKGRVRSVDVNQDRTLAITGSEDKSAIVWELSSSRPLLTIEHNEDVQLVKLSSDGRYALSAAQYDSVQIWDIKQGALLTTLPLKKEAIKRGLRLTAAAFSPSGDQILIAYPNRIVELRDTLSMTLIHQWSLPKRKRWQPSSAIAIDVAFDRTQDHYWALSSDGFIHQLNISANQQETP